MHANEVVIIYDEEIPEKSGIFFEIIKDVNADKSDSFYVDKD